MNGFTEEHRERLRLTKHELERAGRAGKQLILPGDGPTLHALCALFKSGLLDLRKLGVTVVGCSLWVGAESDAEASEVEDMLMEHSYPRNTSRASSAEPSADAGREAIREQFRYGEGIERVREQMQVVDARHVPSGSSGRRSGKSMTAAGIAGAMDAPDFEVKRGSESPDGEATCTLSDGHSGPHVHAGECQCGWGLETTWPRAEDPAPGGFTAADRRALEQISVIAEGYRDGPHSEVLIGSDGRQALRRLLAQGGPLDGDAAGFERALRLADGGDTDKLRWAWKTAADPDSENRELAIIRLECAIGALFGWRAEEDPERAEFEAYADDLRWDLRRAPEGHYITYSVQQYWLGWQARAAREGGAS